MKLNGWQRLWILLCITYFCAIASYVIIEFPKAENIKHSAAFYKKLSKKSAQMLAFADQEVSEMGMRVEMPNGHIIEFKNKSSENEAEAACEEYWKLIENKATEKKANLLTRALLFWLVPCVGLYILGCGINWVYKGFKPNKVT